MDGYAVRAGDTGAPMRIAGEVAAGEVWPGELEAGTAIGITTGAALPPGADAILRVEDAIAEDGELRAAAPLQPGVHVRYAGEDVARGDVLAPAGSALSLQRVTALASAGVGEVAVVRRPVVHVLATGAELLEVGAPAEPGKIHESNRLTLDLLARDAGADVVVHPVVPDDRDATRAAIEAGLAGDVLLITGGVSVGPHDHVKPALEAAGVEEVFWRVRLKPGKPLWFGHRGRTLVFGLPGQPALHGRLLPALRRTRAAPPPGRGRRGARLRRGAAHRARAGGRRPDDAAHRPPAARRRRGPARDAHGEPGLAPHGRARGLGRLRRGRHGARGRRARGRAPPPLAASTRGTRTSCVTRPSASA